MCEILSKQYRDICSNPREDISDEIFKNQLFENNSFENTPSLSDIEVTTEKVKKVISKMSNGAAIGPDGLPVQVFKYGGDFILIAMTNIITLSLVSGEIPSFLKEGWITPIWKGTDYEDLKDYRPIYLTSHTIKIMEQVIRVND